MITQPLNKLLFFDCETAPVVEDFYSLPEQLADIYARKNEKAIDECGSAQDHWNSHAGLEAEYAKVCCISFGSFKDDEKDGKVFRVKSLSSPDELSILTEFAKILEQVKGYSLAGHNILGFDIPFLAKRYIINGLAVPRKLNYSSLKPWEITDFDSMVAWKFGSFSGKNVSLELLCAVLGVPSPKTNMDGSSVGEMFYAGKLDEIQKYCQQDVIAVARVSQRMNLEIPISDDKIRFV